MGDVTPEDPQWHRDRGHMVVGAFYRDGRYHGLMCWLCKVVLSQPEGECRHG